MCQSLNDELMCTRETMVLSDNEQNRYFAGFYLKGLVNLMVCLLPVDVHLDKDTQSCHGKWGQ